MIRHDAGVITLVCSLFSCHNLDQNSNLSGKKFMLLKEKKSKELSIGIPDNTRECFQRVEDVGDSEEGIYSCRTENSNESKSYGKWDGI